MSSEPIIVSLKQPTFESTDSTSASASAPVSEPFSTSAIVQSTVGFQSGNELKSETGFDKPSLDSLAPPPPPPPEADNEAALLLLSFGAAGGDGLDVDVGANPNPTPVVVDEREDVMMKDEEEVTVPVSVSTEETISSTVQPKQPLSTISPNPPPPPPISSSHPHTQTQISTSFEVEKERIPTTFQNLPQQMPPPPSIRSSSPHGVVSPSHAQASSSSNLSYRPPPSQLPLQHPPPSSSIIDVEPSKSVSFAPVSVPNVVVGHSTPGQGPIMGRFDVNPTIYDGTINDDIWKLTGQVQPLLESSSTKIENGIDGLSVSSMTTGSKKSVMAQGQQRKRKRSTSTSASTPGDRQGSLPLAPLAIIPPPSSSSSSSNNIHPSTTSSNPHVRPDLPHFMGINNQTYRCICNTSVEPDKGTSTQCESCCAWQHAECFGLTEDDLDSVSSYFCHLCKPRDIHRNEPYIAELVAIEQASAISTMGDGVQIGTGSRGGKKSRGGGKSRGRAREPSVAAQSTADTPATPGSTRWSQPPGIEDTPGPTMIVQDMPPPASIARPPRKKQAQIRPFKTRLVQGWKGTGAPSPSATPAGSTVPGSPDSSAKDFTTAPSVLNLPQPSVNVAQSSLSTDAIAGSLALRILEYTPTSKNIPHGPQVRKLMAEFMDQWMEQHDWNMTQKDQAASVVAAAVTDKDAGDVTDSAQADEGGEMDVDSEQPQDAQRSASEFSARKRRHLSPSWGSDADYSILGPPVPPVILQGPTLSSLASRVEVREEKDDSSVLPAGMACSPATADSRFDTYTRPTVYGVHVLKSAPEGTYFGEYRGEIMTADDYQSNRINQYVELGLTKPHVHRIGPPLDLIIDARRYGNDLRFIRSGCHPNVVLRPLLHFDDNDENARVELSFGIFASTRIPAGKELVIGWEWDDHHILHNLRAYALEVEASGSFPSSAHNLPQVVQEKFSIVMSCIAGLFPSCACTERMECALIQMQRLGAGLPMLTEKDKEGRSKQRHRKIVANDKAIKLDLGPLVGAARSWRATAATRRSAENLQSKLGSLQSLTRAEPVRAEGQGETELEAGSEAIEEDETGVVRFEKDPVSHEQNLAPTAEFGEDVEMAPPVVQGVESPRSASVATPETKVAELVPPELTEGSSATTATIRSTKSGVRQRATSATTGDSSLSSLGALQDLAEPDGGEISDSSTLTEPLTHASLSERDDDFPEVETRVIKVGSNKTPKVRAKKVNAKSAQRHDGFRKNRRVMSPSSPIIASGQDVEAEEASSPISDYPTPKKQPKPIPDIHFQAAKQPHRRRIVSDAGRAPVPSSTSVKTNIEIEERKASPHEEREAGMTPEIEDLPIATAALASGTPEPEVPNPTEPASIADVPPTDSPVTAASIEVAPPPKKRRIDLKRFAVAAQPTEGEACLQTPNSELATPVETPSTTTSLLGLKGSYPWSNGDSKKASEPVVEPKVPRAEEPSGKSTDETAGNWWARPASNRSFSLSSQLHNQLGPTRPSMEANNSLKSPERPIPSELAPVNGFSGDTPARKSSGSYEPIDSPFDGRKADVTPSFVTRELPSGDGHGSADSLDDHSDVKPLVNGRDENAHLYQEKDTDIKPSVNGHGINDETRWSAMPAALPRRDAPPHVDTDKERFGYAGRSSPPPKHPPTGPRSAWPRDDQPEYDRREDRDWESRDVPRGPRSDFRGRVSSGSFASPSRPPSTFSSSSARGGPYTPRGGWHGDSYRGSSRGRGEPYRGRGAFSRGRGGGGTAGFYSTVRGRP